LAFTIATTFACGAYFLTTDKLCNNKHRNGETGGIKLAWIGQYTRFENLALDSMAQYTPDDAMIDAAYANSAVNFDTEEF
jgi:hypothetical protein